MNKLATTTFILLLIIPATTALQIKAEMGAQHGKLITNITAKLPHYTNNNELIVIHNYTHKYYLGYAHYKANRIDLWLNNQPDNIVTYVVTHELAHVYLEQNHLNILNYKYNEELADTLTRQLIDEITTKKPINI